MGQFFIYIGFSVGVLIISLRLLAVLGEWIFTGEKKDSFSPNLSIDEMPQYTKEPREFELLSENSYNIVSLIFKKIPSLITMWSLGIVFTVLLGMYISTANIERLAAAGSAFESGNTGLALSYLWPMGKDIAIDQYRVSSGSHPMLKERGLKNFKYLSTNNGYHIAMMQDLVTADDIDPSIGIDDEDYGKMILGVEVEDAKEICENMSEDITVSLISKDDWDFSLSHILAKRNINRENGIAEWFGNLDPNDSDNFMLNLKGNKSLIAKTTDSDNFNASENGVYFDEDDIHDYLKVGFRCVAKWGQ